MAENERDFKGVWIPREVWLDNRLNMLEKGILTEIDSLDMGENGCYASNKHIADFCQCSETKVSTAISKLIELDYIYVKSFDGRQRILKSRLSNFERQNFKNSKAESQSLKESNTYKKTPNKTVKKERKKDISGYDAILSESSLDEEVKATVYEFIKMRAFIKKPLTEFALQKMISKLKVLTAEPKKQIAILEKSIVNNWQDIYELKEDLPTPQVKKSSGEYADLI